MKWLALHNPQHQTEEAVIVRLQALHDLLHRRVISRFQAATKVLRRASIDNWDLSLTKRIKIKERATFELRLDAFNALNHTQFDAVNTTLNVTSLTNPTPTNLPFNAAGVLVNANGFGTISSVRPPRNLQLSGHFIF